MADRLKKASLWAVPLLWLAGTLLHFTYEWLGRSPVAGIFSAINESVWEHAKLLIWPLLVFWLLAGILLKIPASRVITSAAASVWGAVILMIALFYAYTGALGIESLVLDILIFLLCIVAGVWLGICVLKRYNGENKIISVLSAIALLALIALTVTATFIQIELPLFISQV